MTAEGRGERSKLQRADKDEDYRNKYEWLDFIFFNFLELRLTKGGEDCEQNTDYESIFYQRNQSFKRLYRRFSLPRNGMCSNGRQQRSKSVNTYLHLIRRHAATQPGRLSLSVIQRLTAARCFCSNPVHSFTFFLTFILFRDVIFNF